MPHLVPDVLVVVAGYVTGSVPFGVVIGRGMHGVDVRERGSGNIGTANVLRTLGWRAAIPTFILDTVKGGAAPLIGLTVAAPWLVVVVAALAALVGHSWPIFARFRGGKCVASAFGGTIVIAPLVLPLAAVAAAIAFTITRTISAASLAAAAAAIVGAVGLGIVWQDWQALCYIVPAALLIFIRHKDNVARLSQGKERKVASARVSRVAKRAYQTGRSR